MRLRLQQGVHPERGSGVQKSLCGWVGAASWQAPPDLQQKQPCTVQLLGDAGSFGTWVSMCVGGWLPAAL